MKNLLLAVILALFTSFVQAQQVQPEPGVYRGYLTIKRSNAALRISEVTTLIVVGEIYPNGPGNITCDLTLSNADKFSALNNYWTSFQLSLANLPTWAPELTFIGNGTLMIPSSPLVPGSLKLSAKSLAWKTSENRPTTYALRKMKIETTFTITRSGASPVADP